MTDVLSARSQQWRERIGGMSTARRVPPWTLPDLPPPSSPPADVTAATMASVDRIATDTFNLSILQMMENAGRGMATLARLTMDGAVEGQAGTGRVTVLVGTGNNAGGGLVAARHLAAWGAEVHVVLARPVARLRPTPCRQLELAVAAGVVVAVAGHDRSIAEVGALVRTSTVVIDALIGYTLLGPPDAAYRHLIESAGLGDGAVLSLDLPSGVDATTGASPGAAAAAHATLTLALPKAGLRHEPARTLAGRLYLADLGIPRAVYAAASVDVPLIFGHGPLVELNPTGGAELRP